MCGICFTIRQRLMLRRRQTGSAQLGKTPPPCTCVAQAAGDTAGGDVDSCSDATAHGVPAELAQSVKWHPIEMCSGPATMRIAPIKCNDRGQLQAALTRDDKTTTVAQASAHSDLFARLVDNVQHRGPDTSGVTRRVLPVTRCDDSGTVCGGVTEVQAAAAVLGLRGSTPVHQPYDIGMADGEEAIDGGVAVASMPAGAGRSFLMWNGEIFDGVLCPPPWGSDTVVLARRLLHMERECAAALRPASTKDTLQGARQALFLSRCVQMFEDELEGPYGFLYYAATLEVVVFGRDPLGRHSLLTHLSLFDSPPEADEDDSIDIEFILSSVGVQHAVQRTGEAAVRVASSSSATATATAASAGGTVDGHDARTTSDTPQLVNATPHDTTASGAMNVMVGVSAGAKKRPRSLTCEDDGDDDNGDEDGAAASGGVPCWSELPVTGLFAVPLHRPLAVVKGAAEPTEWGRHVMLHCPWRRTQYRVHPLLRTVVAREAAAARGRLSDDGACRVSREAGRDRGGNDDGERVKDPERGKTADALDRGSSISDGNSACTSTDVGLTETASWERGFYLQKDMTPPPQLPRALVARVQASTPLSDSEDDVWAHWAAVRYLYALSAAVHRRIDVTRSGADDSRDATKLQQARRRPLCILFSGGIDCTVLAALAHYLLPPETPIELANVAFGAHPEQAPDRVAALRAMDELLRLPQPYGEADVGSDDICFGDPACQAVTFDGCPRRRRRGDGPWEREWRLVLIDVPHKLCEDTPRILDLLTPRHTVLDLDIGTALWSAARGVGRMQVLRRSDLVVESRTAAVGDTESVAGLTLAGFSKHFRVHPATAESRRAMRDSGASPTTTTTPTATGGGEDDDGVTQTGGADGAAAAEAKFDLLVDVLVKEGRQGGGPETPVLLSTLGKEYGVFLQPHIARYGYKKLGSYLNDATHAGVIAFAPNAPSKAVYLVRPTDRERAAALPPTRWLRTRAMTGAAAVPPEGQYETHYVSGAKVMLLGMGADETLGGYTRYRRFFHRHGMPGARQELEKDFARLWLRNLGRDDRITMDSGREPRFPYLDEGVLRTLEYIVAERFMSVSTTATTAAAAATTTTPVSSSRTGGRMADSDATLADDVLRRSIEPVISFRMSPGEGDKRILRNVAIMLGLGSVTRLQKRAIQFGSRVAERRVKGTTVL